MLLSGRRFDMVVIGAGPAGQKAAIQAAKAGRSVLIVDAGTAAGGECVYRGTIPSKTLREAAVYLSGLRRRTEGILDDRLPADLRLECLMRRRLSVVRAHQAFISNQLARNGVNVWSGHARFTSPDTLEVADGTGKAQTVSANAFVIAAGSRPRPSKVAAVDGDRVLDSDSILDLPSLPRSLIVVGGGVIATEYAAVFSALGTEVTIVDKNERLLSFVDPELVQVFVNEFERRNGVFLPGRSLASVQATPAGVRVVLETGESLEAERVLLAAGREASIEGLGLEAAGVRTTPAGHIAVDAQFRTSSPSIFAAGDVIGPPSLAATAMEQGRRAARHALGLPTPTNEVPVPVGIHTLPEIAFVGASEAEARRMPGGAWVGHADFRELARSHINGEARGMLKLIAAGDDGRIVGAHAVGDGVIELVHIAQMAMIGRVTVDAFVDNVFNFPTFAEAYRVAALDIVGRRESRALRHAA